MKIKFFLLTSLFLVSIVSAQKKWTLKECVDHALKNNLTVKQNTLNVELSRLSARNAMGNFLPNLSGSISGSYREGLTDNGTGTLANTKNFSSDLGLNSNGMVFNGFRNLNTYKQAKLGVEISKLTLEQIQNDISLAVINRYLSVLFAKENLGVAKVQADISKSQTEAAKQRFEAGVIPKVDYLNTISTAASDAQSVITRENELTIALLNLSQSLQLPSNGFDIESIKVNDDSLMSEFLYSNASDVYEKALTTQPQINNAKLGVENAEFNIKIAKGAYLPTLSYNIGLGSSYFNQFNNLTVFNNDGIPIFQRTNDNFFDQLNDRFQYGASLSLNIPIFNRTQTKTNVAREFVNKELSKIALTNEKLQLQQTIEQAYVDAKAAAKAYDAANVSLEAQQEAFKNARQSYDLGAMTLFDFDLVRNRLVSAESALIRAKYDYVFKTKVLQFYYGDLTFD